MEHDETSVLVRHIIGANIRALREVRGHNQTKFAEMIGLNRSYLNQIESGKMNASVNVLVKIADGLDVPLTDLHEGLSSTAPHRLPKDTIYASIALQRKK